jgi:cytochrome c553
MTRHRAAVDPGQPTICSAMVLALIIVLAGFAPAGATAPGDAERIYRSGILPSGQPLRGVREGGVPIEGRAAACANCHRRSGIGVNEGRITIPPITG